MPRETTAAPTLDRSAGRPPGEVDDALEAGLDSLQTPAAPRPGGLRRAAGSLWSPTLALVLLLTAWEGYVRLGLQPRSVVPGPADVSAALGALWRSGQAETALATSLGRGLLGFVVAVAVATPVGVLIARIGWLRVALGPLISGLQVLPSVAWVPAAIVWFGLSDATVYFVVLMGAVPSVVNGLLSGVDHVPALVRQVGRVLGASPWEQVRYVVLPAALPGYVTGLRQGWAFSWRSLMAAEVIAAGGRLGLGLGSLLQQGRALNDMPTVVATILLILVVGIVVEVAAFAPLERALLRRRGLAAGAAR